jgi:recombination protein RecA
MGEKALYIDAENMLDYSMLKTMIGEAYGQESLIITTPETAEDAFRMAELGLESGDFALVIIDSIGALAPKKEKEDDFADANVALVPRMVSKFLRRNATGAVARNNVALVLLNQVRDKIGAYMASFETPGGHALKHFSSLRISMSRGQEIKVGKETVGILTKFTIKKNKMSAPFRGYFTPILFGKGIDTYADAVDFCSMLGVIKKSGSFYKFEGETLGQGKIASADYVKSVPGMLDKLREKVYNVLNQNTSIDLENMEEVEEEENE